MEILEQGTYRGAALGRNCRGVRKAGRGRGRSRQKCRFSRISLLPTLQGALEYTGHHRGSPTLRAGGGGHIGQSPATGNPGWEVWRGGSVTPQASLSKHLEKGQVYAVSSPHLQQLDWRGSPGRPPTASGHISLFAFFQRIYQLPYKQQAP